VFFGSAICGEQKRFDEAYDFDAYHSRRYSRLRALTERFDRRFHRAFMVSRKRACALWAAERRERPTGGDELDLSHDLETVEERTPSPG
jgi:hypothetical protein